MWMIRFIQYPRNSVENLNRALYIKLSRIQWLSGSKKISPSPRGEGKWFLRKPHGMKLYKNYYLHCVHIWIFSNRNTRRHPEPRIPPDSRSVQILYRISGMLNESNHSHIGDDTFHNSLRWCKWESSVPGHFCKRDWDFAQNFTSSLSSPFGKMRDLHIR